MTLGEPIADRQRRSPLTSLRDVVSFIYSLISLQEAAHGRAREQRRPDPTLESCNPKCCRTKYLFENEILARITRMAGLRLRRRYVQWAARCA